MTNRRRTHVLTGTGIGLVCLGTALHWRMYVASAEHGYHMAGMTGSDMTYGMAMIVVGVVLYIAGILGSPIRESQSTDGRLWVKALDDAPLRRSHIALAGVMALAVTIDVMKPATLAFAAPGMAEEYGLDGLRGGSGYVTAALLPFVAIIGTVIGSHIWGHFGDRVGRKAAIQCAGVLFVATSVCGAMPGYFWNLGTCFTMGVGVGGMLPILFALMAETFPRRHRGWLMVLVGGDVAGAYIAVTWLASTYGTPDRFGWRILWLIGGPTGLLLMLLIRWIPESPRYLLLAGRDAEARAVMERYGAVVVDRPETGTVTAPLAAGGGRWRADPLSLALVVLALGVGVVQFGFHQWIPANLRELGIGEAESSRILRNAALLGFPLNLPVAYFYGFWSTRRVIVGLALMTALSLVGFAWLGDSVVENRAVLKVLLITPIWGISSLTAVLVAYAAEVYPTDIRSRGTGLVAGATKLGGVAVLALVTARVAAPSIAVTALVGAVPLVLGMAALLRFGLETRQRHLEAIEADGAPRGRTGEPVPLEAAAFAQEVS